MLQVKQVPDEEPNSSMSRRVKWTHQGAHSSNTQLHTKETSSALSCFPCFCLPLSLLLFFLSTCCTLTATHMRDRLYTHVYELQLLWGKRVTCLLVFLYPVLWIKAALKQCFIWNKITMACWSTCFAGVVMNYDSKCKKGFSFYLSWNLWIAPFFPKGVNPWIGLRCFYRLYSRKKNFLNLQCCIGTTRGQY